MVCSYRVHGFYKLHNIVVYDPSHQHLDGLFLSARSKELEAGSSVNCSGNEIQSSCLKYKQSHPLCLFTVLLPDFLHSYTFALLCYYSCLVQPTHQQCLSPSTIPLLKLYIVSLTPPPPPPPHPLHGPPPPIWRRLH